MSVSVTWLGVGLAVGGSLVCAAAALGPELVSRYRIRRHQRAIEIEFGGRRLG